MKSYAIIMAGGSGTRFWPKSTNKNPKQLLSLVDEKSMLQVTCLRLKGLVADKDRWIVTTKALSKQTKKQVPKSPQILEPEGRNTMAAVCLAAWNLNKVDSNALVSVLPADAHVANTQGYLDALKKAFQLAANDKSIVCLGIKPTFPATGYGYIEARQDGTIERFVEKPKEDKAREFFDSGKHLWNAGIFVFHVPTFISEVRRVAPEFATIMDQIIKSPKKINALYKKLPKLPIDIALMEKTNRGAVVPGDFGWNDVGSWPALADVIKVNNPAGVVRGGEVVSVNSIGNIVDVTKGKTVGLIGIQDLIVVETKDAILICSKAKAQDVKTLVDVIKTNKKLAKKLL